MAKIIPFAPVPMPILRAITAPLMRFSVNTGKVFPNLGFTLKQAEMGLDEREYGAIMIFLVLFYMIFFGGLITLVLSKMTEHYLAMGLGIGLFMGGMMFVQAIMYPALIVRKKVRNVEKNLVFALRAILVQIKSGVSLFDSMTMVSRGSYGAISEEFQKAIDSINTGTPEQEALETMSEKNPSHFMRKSIWQIVNGMNAGADISMVLGETVSSMIREQKIAINKYGAQLRVLSLMYMMIGVIMPTLGVTLLIILFTFPMVGDAIEKQPALNTTAELLQAVVPGETYGEGDLILSLSGKRQLSGKNIGLRVKSLEGKNSVLELVEFLEGQEEPKVVETQSVYGAGSNLRDYFLTAENTTKFGESLKVKSIGKNLFGQNQLEVTRLEPTHLVFWGLLGLVAVMQFMYIGIIKSRRPNIIG